jgi:hypothetical protein
MSEQITIERPGQETGARARGGELLYAMTATGPEQIEFMQNAGMPLTTQSRKTFTEVIAGRRLAYNSLVDFAPGVEPYEHLTVVEGGGAPAPG